MRWVPKRKQSIFAAESFAEVTAMVEELGGFVASVDTRSGEIGTLECAFFEAADEDKNKSGFVYTGAVVCLQGLPHRTETVREWHTAATKAGWLRAGTIVAVPNMQMSSALQAADVAAVIDAAVQRVGMERCVLAAKDLVAPCVVEAIANDLTDVLVPGLVLVAPTSPPPLVCSELTIPVLLLWSQDDNVCAFGERIPWKEALDNREGPTTMKDCKFGKHRIDKMLGDKVMSEAAHGFIVSSLLIAELVEHDEDEEPLSPGCGRRIRKLTEELPEFLRQASLHSHVDEDTDKSASKERLAALRLSSDLGGWVQSGMVQSSE